MVALGLILALSVIALPASAATNTCSGKVAATSYCAGATANYTINFTAPVTLTPGNDLLSFTFGAGTNLTKVTKSGVTVAGAGSPSSVTIADNHIEFPVPGTSLIYATQNVSVTIVGVQNPTTDGSTSLCLDYQLVCCQPVVFCCVTYVIQPLRSTYDFTVDFSPTFDGIAKDFVPPFQACGQCGYGTNITGMWFDDFNITLETDVLGCKGYSPVWVTFNLTEAPSTTAKASLKLYDGTWHSWVLTTKNATTSGGVWGPPSGFDLAANYSVATPAQVHFDTPGTYKVLLQLEYLPEASECEPAPTNVVLVSKEYTAVVYQWKEAFKIPLYAKWNLVSLPFRVFDSDIETMLESYPYADNITAIWNFDQCADDWFGYPDHGLTDMVDGDAYWIRLPYGATVPAGTAMGGWWVFGTDRPYEEAPVPFNYPVCEGWNMVGFTPVWNMGVCPHVALSANDKDYLWNWWSYVGAPEYGRIYGWDPTTQTWLTYIPGTAGDLQPGAGYWISFLHDGFVNP